MPTSRRSGDQPCRQASTAARTWRRRSVDPLTDAHPHVARQAGRHAAKDRRPVAHLDDQRRPPSSHSPSPRRSLAAKVVVTDRPVPGGVPRLLADEGLLRLGGQHQKRLKSRSCGVRRGCRPRRRHAARRLAGVIAVRIAQRRRGAAARQARTRRHRAWSGSRAQSRAAADQLAVAAHARGALCRRRRGQGRWVGVASGRGQNHGEGQGDGRDEGEGEGDSCRDEAVRLACGRKRHGGSKHDATPRSQRRRGQLGLAKAWA